MPTKTIDETLAWLKAGNARFVADTNVDPRRDSIARKPLVHGQDPEAIILSCADSRVAPELLFDTGLGDLFVIRVAGNIANTSSIASIEYSVANLGTQVIVVLGHQSCGAVQAAMAGGDNGYNLNHLLSHLLPAVHEADTDDVKTVVHLNARKQAEELVARSAILRDAVARGELRIVAAYKSLVDGSVTFLDDAANA